MKKFFTLFLSVLMVFALVACGGAPASSNAGGNGGGDSSSQPAAEVTSEVKIAVVTSKRGDNGFNDQAWMGAQMAQQDFGFTLDDAQATDMPEADAALRNYADTGEYDLIIIVGSNYTETLSLVAADYPDQKFTLIDAILDPPMDNVSSNATIDGEQGFLSGVISGLVTRGDYADAFPRANTDKNVIVYAGGMDNPTSRAGAAGYMAGVLYVNPDCEIIYNVVGSYQDPVKAKEIAMNGVARGADIITGNCGSGSLGLNEAAIEAGVYFIATSLSGVDPECSLCTSVKLTENEVYDEIKAVIEGTYTPGGERLGIANGYCDVSIEGVEIEYPQELLDTVDAIREEVREGKISVPEDVADLDAWKAENSYKA